MVVNVQKKIVKKVIRKRNKKINAKGRNYKSKQLIAPINLENIIKLFLDYTKNQKNNSRVYLRGTGRYRRNRRDKDEKKNTTPQVVVNIQDKKKDVSDNKDTFEELEKLSQVKIIRKLKIY